MTSVRPGSVIVLSAPSGAGKSTLVRRLLQYEPVLGFSVSHTTRPPRAGEHDGEHYHFVSADRFRHMIHAGDFLEWALVHGEHYGTSREEVARRTEAGKDVLLDIDVQGALQIRGAAPAATLVFLLPPSYDELRRRLQQRGTEDASSIERRLRRAEEETRDASFYDYFVVNDDLEQAVGDLRAILRAARHKATVMDGTRQAVLQTFPRVGA